MWGRTSMPITQAKTGHNAVAVARARDAIGMTEAEAGMLDGLAGGENAKESVEDILWAVAMLPEFQLIY